MVVRPLLRPPSPEVRTQAARAAALALDRRRLRPAARSTPDSDEAAAVVHPVGPLADDPEAAAIAAALARPSRFGRRLLRPATLPAGLDPALDEALAALPRDQRLAVTLSAWLGWEAPRIAPLLGRTVLETHAVVAGALAALGAAPEAVGRHLAQRARELRPAAPRRAPTRAAAAAAAGVAAAGLAMFAGAASAPLPTVGPPPDIDLALVELPETRAPYPPSEVVDHRVAGSGEALAWAPAPLPAGVAFRWVLAVDGGFVAVGVDPAAATDRLVLPAGFWLSRDGLDWQPLGADATAFGPDDVVSAVAAGPAGIVAVGGQHYGVDAVVRPVAWRLAPGGAAWERAGLRTPPLGGPASIRQVYRDVSVVAVDGGFLATARGGFAPTGRNLPTGFAYLFDELGVTLQGPAGATVQRLGFDDIGLSGQAATRLVSGEQQQAAWRSADGLRWAPVAVDTAHRLGAPVQAAGRLWSAAAGTLTSSAEGQRWTPVDLEGVELGATSVAGHPGGLVVATGDRVLVAADATEWFTLALPPGSNVFTGARWVAGGRAGVVAYGTMGSDAGWVVVPQVTVPGVGAAMEVDLVTGQLDVVEPDGTIRHTGRYFEGGTFRADHAAGAFAVVDGFGQVQMTGRIDDWAAAVAAAERTPYPPAGPIAVWFSRDGEGWRLQDLDARGFPSAVAVGADRVVVAAVQPGRPGRTALPQLWVGTS